MRACIPLSPELLLPTTLSRIRNTTLGVGGGRLPSFAVMH